MTYRAAMDIPGLPRHREARIYCDGCSATVPVVSRRGGPFAWFLLGKPPKGWLAAPKDEFRSWHWCTACRSWAGALLDAGLVRDKYGWVGVGAGAGPEITEFTDGWFVSVDGYERAHATEETAARAWLAAQGGSNAE